MHGFELEVEIKFVRRDSGLVMPRDKTTGAADCRVVLSSVSRKAGVVRSLYHGLASNTTCTWEFQVSSLSTGELLGKVSKISPP